MNNNNTNSPSVWGIFYKPTSQFKQIKENPIILKPLLFILLIIVIEIILFVLKLITEYRYTLFGETVTAIPWDLLVKWIGIFLFDVIIKLLILIFITSLVLFLVAKLFRLTVTYKQLASMMTYIYIPSIIIVFYYIFIPKISDGGVINDWFYISIRILSIIIIIWQLLLVVKGLKVISASTTSKIFLCVIGVIFLLFNTYLYIHFEY